MAYLPYSAEAVIAFLATASLGAIWSACGMDRPTPWRSNSAASATLEPSCSDCCRRLPQRRQDLRPQATLVAELRAGLPSPLRAFVHVDRIGAHAPAGAVGWDEFTSGDAELTPTRVPFDQPLWVLFSSGTTGLPKGIVHGHGGVLLEHLKALALHNDLGPGDRFWWYTTPSWMMWNYQVSGLLVGATIVTYDGSPSYPSTDALWSRAAEHRVNLLGTSPAYLAACAKAGLEPAATHDLSALRALGVTGSTLPAASCVSRVDEHVGA